MSAHENHDYDLKTATRDGLRKLAAELDIPGRGKMLKSELVEAIAHARAKRIKTNVNAQIHVYAEEASEIMTGAPARDGISTTIVDAFEALNASRDVHAIERGANALEQSIKPMTRKIREALRRRPERGLVNGQPMPLRHRGRAMGAKHLPDPWGTRGMPGERGMAVPMTDGKRRLNYMAQNGTPDVERFTPKQRRRYAKKKIRSAVRAVLASA
jgi:Rho termination factor-like protein